MAPNASIKLLHFADLHLDRPFVGLSTQDARARRRELREALERCLALAVEHRVDAVTIGGDLWEDEHVTPDTSRWVADRLGSLGVPVVLVAGNHDPLRPGGPHRRVEWPANVHLLPADQSPTHPRLHGQEIGPLTVWGMSWGAAPLTAEALRAFSVPRDGRIHVLLLHGTAGRAALEEHAHCPFTAAAVRAAGMQLCLAGHLHAAGVREDIVVYPGSPEPLAWDGTGRHTVAIVELSPSSPPAVELIDVNRRRCAETVVDCEGARSSADIERALREAITHAAAHAPDGWTGGRTPNPPPEGRGGEGLCLRAVLRGRVDPECRIDLGELAAGGRHALARGELTSTKGPLARAHGATAESAESALLESSPPSAGGQAAATSWGLALLDLRDETQPAFDLDALAAQPTAIGLFVRDLRERIERCPAEDLQRPRLELALDLGLRAMHGDDLAHAS